MKDVVEEYERRYESFLKTVADNLAHYLRDCFDGTERIDRIGARAKAPDRFSEKAKRFDDAGNPKYKVPLTEIQDLIGARVIVFYKDDVEVATKVVDRYFQHIESKEMVPDCQWKFGYFGQHMILALPKDVLPTGVPESEIPQFFELQIKTLFQHAWSEANHDLGYKSPTPLSDDQQRRLAFTAAQAWGAYRVFFELHGETKAAL